MDVSFKPSFIKDYQNLPVDVRKEVKRICLIIFPKLKTLFDFREYKIRPNTEKIFINVSPKYE